jgi:SAM-dependent methyltransferase
MSERRRDIWAEWLAEHRYGGDPEVRREMLERLGEVRDKVLDHAAFAEGETLLDVGCGEGLIGFGALERGAHVVFSDISDDLLDLCRETADALGVLGRCSFVNAGAEDLAGIRDASVDVVATRSVLIYVKEKTARSASSSASSGPEDGSRSSSRSTASASRRKLRGSGATRVTDFPISRSGSSGSTRRSSPRATRCSTSTSAT